MPQTVEAIYHDGVVELKQMPSGIRRAKALVIFLDDSEEATEHHAVDLDQVKTKQSAVDKWIGVIEGAELGDWKTERRVALEGKPRESAH